MEAAPEKILKRKYVFPKKVGIIFLENSNDEIQIDKARKKFLNLFRKLKPSSKNFYQDACTFFLLQMNHQQKTFEFQVVGTDKMPSQDSDAVNLLDKIALDSTLEIDYWIGITSGLVRMKEHNWFFTTEPIENTNSGKRLWIITTSDWERNFSPPSVFEYLSSSVARCAIESLSRQLEHDETKKLKKHDIQLTKGCVFDFTTYKPYRRISVSNPYLCDECMEKLSLLEKLVHKKHSEFPLVNDIRALVSRDWMGNLKERDSPSYNLKKIYKCDIDRNSGFNKTLLEKLRDSIIDNTAQWIIGTAIGGIIAAIISIGVFLLTGIRT